MAINQDICKNKVRHFWNKKSCGEVYATETSPKAYYESQAVARYALEPYLYGFAKFAEGKAKDVLEIGIGMGADHIEWAKSKPKSLTGIDLTSRAVTHTKKRLSIYEYRSDIKIGDAEALPFADNSFDLVYSWGVLHHSPNTHKAIDEVFRVLRPGGIARVMIYHKYSLTGYMLWIRYSLLKGRLYSLRHIYAHYLESPGTKAYSVIEAKEMLSKFSWAHISTQLGFGDLLEGAVGQRHRGILLSIAKKIWPRRLLKIFFKKHGLMLLIEAKK